MQGLPRLRGLVTEQNYMVVLKWTLRALGGLFLLFAFVALGLYVHGQQVVNERLIPQRNLAENLAAGDARRGAHWATVVGCSGCHGAKLGGNTLINSGMLAVLYAPNLTRGNGGVGATFSDADWIRALRFGIAPGGRKLLIMPSRNFAEFSNHDLADTVAFIKSVPPVNNVTPALRVGPLGYLIVGAGQINFDADEIRRDHPTPSSVPAAVSAAYGHYLVRVVGCIGCHGASLSGGQSVGPGGPPAQNLTTAGDLGRWTFAQFRTTLRSGRRPDGTHLASSMPWAEIGQMSDNELQAIYLYLKMIPA